MAAVLGASIADEQSSVMRFCGEKLLIAKDINREMFPVYSEKCLSHKAIHNCSLKKTPW
jgi:hypothetical protein